MKRFATSIGTSSPSPSGARVVRRNCACGAAKSADSEHCSECASAKLQRKLTVGSNADASEREADRVAEQVVGLSSAVATHEGGKPVGVNGTTFRPAIRRHAFGDVAQVPAPQSVYQTLSTPGAPMAMGVRRDMERRFGHDFSRVRVHVDAGAAESARHINANAYTSGNHIVFGAGQFAPQTLAGRRLLAHELTHVVQQNDGAYPTPARALVQRDDAAFNPYPDPADLFRMYFAEMITDQFDGIGDHLKIAVLTHPEPARYLQEVFSAAAEDYPRWEDSIAAALVSRLKDRKLDQLASSKGGRYALSQMYVAMVTGSVTDFETKQAQRILFAKIRQYDPEDFLAMSQRRPGGMPTRIFPIRFMRVTGGAYATPTAELQDDGMVRVAYPQNITYTSTFKRELKTMGNFVGGDGDVINANEIVIIKDYENGGAEVPMPALALVDYANRSTRSTLGKIVEVSIFAATLGLTSGAAVAAEAGEQAAVRFTATAIWGARIANVARILDVAANVISVAAFVIDENREWIIAKLGRAGEWLVRISDTLNTAAAIYGIARLGQAGFKYARDFRRAAKEARAASKGLNNAQTSVIDEIDDKLGKLVDELDAQAAQKAKASTAARETPETPTHADQPSKPTAKDEPSPTERPKKPLTDEEALNATAKAHGLSPKTLRSEVDDMSSQLRDPDNVMLPDDPKLDIELGTDKSGEPHQFSRKRAERTWCRHSEDEACELVLGAQFNNNADTGIRKAKEALAAPPKPSHKEPFDMNRIGAPTEAPQMLGTNLSAAKLQPGQDALYIVRNSEGTVLKVGKTSDVGIRGRFSVYKRGGKISNMTIEIEVYPLKIQPRPLARDAKLAEFYEGKLRSTMETEGHKMPWDNTNNRLGREGFGTPGEGLRTSRIPRDQMEALLRKHNGNKKLVGEELGIHQRTVDLWAKSLGLRPRDFKK